MAAILLTTAVALIAVYRGVRHRRRISKAQNPGRVVVAVHPPANEPGGEAVALMDKPGKAAQGENENLKSAAEGQQQNVEECWPPTATSPFARTTWTRPGRNWKADWERIPSIPGTRGRATKRPSLWPTSTSSQVSRLDKVISDLRSDNLGAELSDGRARFLFEGPRPLLEPTDGRYPFQLMTGRGSAAQWHTQTRTAKSDVLRKLSPRELYVK